MRNTLLLFTDGLAANELLAKENTPVQQAMRETLTGLELDRYLLAGGASPEDLAALRQRIVGTNWPGPKTHCAPNGGD